jgi:DNA-binding NtrC family response regulator
MTSDTDDLLPPVEPRRPRVLLVDGDRERSLRHAVWLAGHEVTRCHRGKDALARLDPEPDVVVVARDLPYMSGAAVLSSIRDRDVDVRVALVCGPDETVPLTDADVDAVLREPLTADDLAGAVTRLLAQRDRQRLWLELSSKRVRRNVLSVEGSSEGLERLERDIDRLGDTYENPSMVED